MHTLFAAAALSLAIAVPAQTFVVDVDNGPGTDFTSIAAATAAAPSGSVLLIRTGGYAEFTINGKSLTLLADPGVAVFNAALGGVAIQVLNLAAGQQVVLHGLEVAQATPYDGARIRCVNCQGAVLLDSVRKTTGVIDLQLQGTNCDRLLVRGMNSATSPVQVNLINSNTVLQSCTLGGFTVSSAIVQDGGTLDLVDSSAVGGVPLGAALPAVMLNGGELHLLGSSSVTGFGTVPCISGTGGTVLLDPGVALNGNGIAPAITVVTKPMSSLTTTFTGTHAEATLNAPAGWFGAIAISLPGPRVPLPGWDEAVWLDGGALQFLANGLTGPGSPVVASLPWTLGLLVGYPSMWQGVTFDPVGGLQVSNPALLVLR